MPPFVFRNSGIWSGVPAIQLGGCYRELGHEFSGALPTWSPASFDIYFLTEGALALSYIVQHRIHYRTRYSGRLVPRNQYSWPGCPNKAGLWDECWGLFTWLSYTTGRPGIYMSQERNSCFRFARWRSNTSRRLQAINQNNHIRGARRGRFGGRNPWPFCERAYVSPVSVFVLLSFY